LGVEGLNVAVFSPLPVFIFTGRDLTRIMSLEVYCIESI